MAVKPNVYEDIEELFEAYGIPLTHKTEEHFLVFMTALSLYAQRDTAYNSVWRQYGALSNLVRGATKVDRLMQVWWHGENGHRANPLLHKDNLDDAFDAINYLTFFIRCAREANIYGVPQTRPDLET